MTTAEDSTKQLKPRGTSLAYTFVPEAMRRRIAGLSLYRSPRTEAIKLDGDHTAFQSTAVDVTETPNTNSNKKYGPSVLEDPRSSSSSLATPTDSRTPPPPGYIETIMSRGGDLAGMTTAQINQSANAQAGASISRLEETNTGIRWTWATQGMELLQLCMMRKGDAVNRDSKTTEIAPSSPVRALYIHAVTYLLRALPSDMTCEEQATLRIALPANFDEGDRDQASSQASHSHERRKQAGDSRTASILHRIARRVTFNTFLLLSILLPLVVGIFNILKALAARYHLKERMFDLSSAVLALMIAQARHTGQRSVQLYERADIKDEGKTTFGLERAFWVGAISLSGGVRQGLSEALASVQTSDASVAAWTMFPPT